MERRDFMKACAAAAVAAPTALDAKELSPRFYTKSRLVDESRQPIRAGALSVGRNYIFHYPFEGTPCFLLDLGTPTVQNVALRTEDGGTYEWPGGAGRKRSVVAYSDTIHCCSEHSQYDPRAGARVLDGPAPQPLSAILLEYEPATDGLYALGTLGGEMFNQFFTKYELRLELDYGSGRPRRRVGAQTIVTDLTSFCKQQVRC
jgi:Rieske Fe-S protein